MKTKTLSVIISTVNKLITGERQRFFVCCLLACVLFFPDPTFLKGDAVMNHGNRAHSEQKEQK